MQEIKSGAGCKPLLALFLEAGVELDYFTHTVWREVDGRVTGGFAFTGHGADTIQAHFVGADKYWISPELLRAVFAYPFDQLGVKVILGYLPQERAHAIKVALKLGWKEICVIPGVDIHMLAMVREDCRWLDLPSRGVNG